MTAKKWAVYEKMSLARMQRCVVTLQSRARALRETIDRAESLRAEVVAELEGLKRMISRKLAGTDLVATNPTRLDKRQHIEYGTRSLPHTELAPADMAEAREMRKRLLRGYPQK